MTIKSGTRFAAISRARSLVKHHSSDTLAIERLATLGRFLGVSSIEPDSMHSSGSVTRRADGKYEIRYSDTLHPHRRNFTIAHELGHIVLYQFEPYKGGKRPHELSMAGERYRATERLVDRLASELLMPENAITDALRAECEQQRSDGASRIRYLQAIRALQNKFDVSQSALILRLRELPQLHTIQVRIALNRQITSWNTSVTAVRHSSGIKVIPSASRPNSVVQFLESCIDGAYHEIIIQSPNGSRVLQCQGWTRKFQTPRGRIEEYCITGWTWNSQSIPYYDDAR